MGEDRPPYRALQSQNIVESSGGRTTLDPQGHRDVLPVLMRNELSDAYAVASEGMEMDTNSGDTVLTGKIIDQPHLYGILSRINGLGLKLVSVYALPEDANPGAGGKRELEESEL